MSRITHESDNCNTWKAVFGGDNLPYGLVCPLCSSFDSFLRKKDVSIRKDKKTDNTKMILIWEIYIPADFGFGEWDRVVLRQTQVTIPRVVCTVCKAEHYIYPSFVIEGTTLTPSALVFVAFAYRYSELTWRDMPELFCTADKYVVSHSVLYKAVHGIGKTVAAGGEAAEKIGELAGRFFPPDKGTPGSPSPLSGKAVRPHTIERMTAVSLVLSPLTVFIADRSGFVLFMYGYKRLLEGIGKKHGRLVSTLYKYLHKQTCCRFTEEKHNTG